MKVLIATKNQAKIDGATKALEVFYKDFEIIGIDVSSDVSEQPVNDEVVKGANNRIKNLMAYANKNGIKADLFMATEAGLTNQINNKWGNVNYAVVVDANNNFSFGTSAIFPIPEKYVDEIKKKSLSVVMDKLFAEQNSGQNVGGIRYLTNGAFTRIDLVKQAFTMALTTTNNVWKDNL